MALSDYSNIRTALFVKLEVDEYLQSGGNLAAETLLFSDHFVDLDLLSNGETYIALGNLMDVTSTTAELTPTQHQLSVILSGIPTTNAEEIIESKIKGSNITVYRGFFNQDGSILVDAQVTNPVGRFIGYVNNVILNEEYNVEAKMTTLSIQLECASIIDVLGKKSAGRKTNPASMKKYFPGDKSFDRTPSLVEANINFGRP